MRKTAITIIAMLLLATSVFAAETLIREYTVDMTADREVRLKIDNPKTALSELSIDPAVDLQSAKINIYGNVDSPDKDGAPGTVHSYIKIEKKFSDSYMKSAAITVRVEKDWLKDKDISQTKVRIYDNDLSGWRELTTKEVNNDANYFYFKATADDLDYFAVSTVAGEAGPVVEEKTEEANVTKEVKTEEEVTTKEEKVVEETAAEKKEEEPVKEEEKDVVSEPITTVEKGIEWSTVWVSGVVAAIVAAIVSAIVVLSMHGKRGMEREDEEEHIRRKVEQQMSRKEEAPKPKKKQEDEDDVFKYAR